MTRKSFALLLLAAPAMAQTAPVPVFYAYDLPGANHWLVDNAMRTVLARPELLAAAKRDAKVLEITVTGKVIRDSGDDSRGFAFTLGFYRDGERLGEAAEYCRIDKMADCADQLVSDITSADAIRH